MADVQGTKVTTPKAMLSYPHIAEAQVQKDDAGNPKGKPKFSAALVFAKGTDLTALQKAVKAAGEAKWPGKFDAMILDSRKSVAAGGRIKFNLPFRMDGEEKGYAEGSTFINVRTEQKPGCVYSYAEPGTAKPAVIPPDKIADELYPGAFVRATIVAFGYDREGNKGVSFALNNIQKLGEGERLDNRKAAVDEFDVDLSAAPADLDTLLGQ
jgi:hypothetical protein